MEFSIKLAWWVLKDPIFRPMTHPRDYQGGESKRGEWGLIDHIFFSIKGGGWLGPDP